MPTPSGFTNQAGDKSQAVSKLCVGLAQTILPAATLDSLRSIAGAAGGETTLIATAPAGSTGMRLADVTNILTLLGGSELWLWNPTLPDKYNYERVIMESVTAGAPPTGVVALVGKTQVHHAMGTVVSATPPFDDITRAALVYNTSAATPEADFYLTFSNANPAALAAADVESGALVCNHVERISYSSANGAAVDADIPIPLVACPSRYIALISHAANWNFPNERGLLNLWRKRGNHVSMPRYVEI